MLRLGTSFQLRPKMIAAPSVSPVTLDEAKKHCRVEHSDDDTLIQILIDAAVQHLDGLSGILGRCMINQTWRFPVHDWAGSYARIPLPDVSAVVVKYRDAGDVEQTLDPQNFRLVEAVNGAVVEWADQFTYPALFNRSDAVAYEVIAGFGAAPADVPAPLRTAITILAGTWYQNREAYTTDGGLELPFAVTRLIAGYRRNTI